MQWGPCDVAGRFAAKASQMAESEADDERRRTLDEIAAVCERVPSKPASSFWEALPRQTVNEIVRGSLDCGVNWFDTAEAYGGGRSEAALARSLVEAGKKDGDIVVATKWAPFLTTASNIQSKLRQRRRVILCVTSQSARQ